MSWEIDQKNKSRKIENEVKKRIGNELKNESEMS